MNSQIINNIAKFLYINNFEDSDDIYAIYNMWLSSNHFVMHNISDVLCILGYIKRVQAMDKAFLFEALSLEENF